MKIEKKQSPPLGNERVKRESPGKQGSQETSLSGSKTLSQKRPSEEIHDLLKSLRPSLLAMKVPDNSVLRSSLPPLLELLSALQAETEDSQGSDLFLLKRVLSSWLDKYSAELPSRQRKELTELVNMYRNMISDNPPYVISGPGGEKLPGWRLIVKPDSRGRNPDEEDDSTSCRLDLQTRNLGEISVRISRGDRGEVCLFSSGSKAVRSLLAGSFAGFRKQLEKSGLNIPHLKVGSPSEKQSNENGKSGAGVDLWG